MRPLSTLIVFLCLTLPAAAQSPFQAVVENAITEVIRPGYATLAGEAATMETAMQALCAAPDEAGLDRARTEFGNLVEAWSAIELIRFGPVRRDNRYEKLNFWPDRKSRGLKQVGDIIRSKDPTVLDVATLREKSVAVQGIGALEYVLFGTGADALGEASPDSAHRCGYGAAIAGAIRTTADELVAEWADENGFTARLTKTGDDNPAYRAPEEAARELLRAMTEELQFARDIKLAKALGEAAKKAKPKQAPFWRSNLTLRAVRANATSVRTLFDKGNFASALPDDQRWITGSVSFEIGHAIRTLEKVDGPVATAFRDADQRGLLNAAIIALNGAGEAIGTHYAGATGLIIGFNSLDGD